MANISLSNNDRLAIISNLATMLTAGIPILEAVDSLIEDSKGNQKKILVILKEDLNQGKTISSSLAKNKNAFDPVVTNLLSAAEKSGTLDSTLTDLERTIKKDMEFNSKVKSAMIYPMFVGVVFLGVMLVMLLFVVPRITEVFEGMNVPLPLPTKILMMTSKALINNTILFFGTIAVILVGFVMLFKLNKKLIMNFFFSLPLLSKLAIMIDLTRFSRSMSLLLTSGVPITEALDLCRNVVKKQEVFRVITKTRDMVNSGKKLSEGFKSDRKVIPTLMLRITEAGEKTGSLEKSMQDIADNFDNQVSELLKALTSLLEPALLVGMALMVGGMLVAIIAPIYSLIGSVNNV